MPPPLVCTNTRRSRTAARASLQLASMLNDAHPRATQARNNISRGLDRVRNESVAMTKHTGDELHAGEHRIDEHAELRGARADVRGVGRLGWSQCVVGR